MLLLMLLSKSMRRSVQVRLPWSLRRYRWARMKYGPNTDDPRASMTEFLMTTSVVNGFIGGVEEFPCALCVGVVVLVRKEVCQGGHCWRYGQLMRSVRNWLHN